MEYFEYLFNEKEGEWENGENFFKLEKTEFKVLFIVYSKYGVQN